MGPNRKTKNKDLWWEGFVESHQGIYLYVTDNFIVNVSSSSSRCFVIPIDNRIYKYLRQLTAYQSAI